MASVFMGLGDDAVPILAVRSSMPGGVGEMLMTPVTSMAYRMVTGYRGWWVELYTPRDPGGRGGEYRLGWRWMPVCAAVWSIAALSVW